jgi:hypothetical protein
MGPVLTSCAGGQMAFEVVTGLRLVLISVEDVTTACGD